MQPFLYLASSSARRQELLRQLGLSFQVVVPDIDETPSFQEEALPYVARLAKAKAEKAQTGLSPEAVVLAADTSVIVDGHILGKPEDFAHACSLWRRLSGRWHRVVTAVAVSGSAGLQIQVVTTEVEFRELSEAEMTAYWETGEPQDKAGGYGIQGKGAIFVRQICGSYSNVVGLPLTETAAMLSAQGITIWNQPACRP